MRVTICLGGSTFNSDGLEIQTIEEIADSINAIMGKNHEVLVVVGGGSTARTYISAGEKLGAPNKELDRLGIMATRLNAGLLISALGDIAGQDPPREFEMAIRVSLRGKVPVMGGTTPGHTTDAVAAELADVSDSELLVFFTDVDGVYTADPDEDEEAEKIENMKVSELVDLMSKLEFKPGMAAIIDPLAARIMEKSNIRSLVLGKDEIERLPEIIEGSEHCGTEIVPEDRDSKG